MILEQINNILSSNFSMLDISVNIDERNIVYLKGDCDNWEQLDKLCHEIAKVSGVVSLVSELTVNGKIPFSKDYTKQCEDGLNAGEIESCDVVIVGGGITGCAVARELSRYNLNIVLIEKDSDLACGATKANNGDIHSGYIEKPGTLKAKLNVIGNPMYTQWAQELNFPFTRPGNLLVLNDARFKDDLEHAVELAKKNNVPFERVGAEEILKMEPIFKDADTKPVEGIFLPSMGTVDPWEVAIALAENAVDNGCKVLLEHELCQVNHKDGKIVSVLTNKGTIKTNYIINCAGVYADDVSDMAGDKAFTIHPRKGTIAIVDKNIPSYNRPVRVIDEERRILGHKNTKGGGMATTISGNSLMGPSATEVANKEDFETTAEGLDEAMARNSIKELKKTDVIRYFSGTRAATYNEDFYIKPSEKTNGLINVAGIQSPGLAASPAIADLAISLLLDVMKQNGKVVVEKSDFNPIRKAPVRFSECSVEEQDKLIKENPAYAKIICRCEAITEGEIIDAIKSPIVPLTIDAIKRRTRAGMGRCQGGFCQPRVLEIIARELNTDWTNVSLKGIGSEILIKNNRNWEEQ